MRLFSVDSRTSFARILGHVINNFTQKFYCKGALQPTTTTTTTTGLLIATTRNTDNKIPQLPMEAHVVFKLLNKRMDKRSTGHEKFVSFSSCNNL